MTNYKLPNDSDNKILDELKTPVDKRWDDLYDKYLLGEGKDSYKPEKLYVIHVTHLLNKKVVGAKPEAGYIKFEPRTKDTLPEKEPESFTVVSNIKDGSKFTEEDAEKMIEYIRKSNMFRLIKNEFKTEDAPESPNDFSGNPLEVILCRFFDVLVGQQDADNFLKPVLNFLIVQINRREKSYLVSNLILKFLGNAYRLKGLNFPISSNLISKITNTIIKGSVSQSSVEFGGNFKGTLIYNPNLYDYKEEEIQQLFKYYDYFKKISKKVCSVVANKEDKEKDELDEIEDEIEVKAGYLPDNVMIKLSDNDMIGRFLETNSISLDGIVEMGYVTCDLIKHKVEGKDTPIINSPIRDKVVIEALMDRLASAVGESSYEDDYGDYLKEDNFILKIVKDDEFGNYDNSSDIIIKGGELKAGFLVFEDKKLKLSSDNIIQVLKGKTPLEGEGKCNDGSIELIKEVDKKLKGTAFKVKKIPEEDATYTLKIKLKNDSGKLTTETFKAELVQEQVQNLMKQQNNNVVEDETIQVTRNGQEQTMKLSDLANAFDKIFANNTSEEISKFWSKLGNMLNQKRREEAKQYVAQQAQAQQQNQTPEQ